MDLNLDREQRAQLELISMHAGKPPAQLLVEAASYLFARNGPPPDATNPDVTDPYAAESSGQVSSCQTFLRADELEQRFERLLRR